MSTNQLRDRIEAMRAEACAIGRELTEQGTAMDPQELFEVTGDLQGLANAEPKARYGEEQFMAWRRSYDTPPPPIEKGSEYSQDADPRYASIGGGPLTECLADVVARFVPYFTSVIAPDLLAGKTVLVAAHGNSLRALVKYLDGMSDADVVGLNIPTGIPLVYELDEALKPTVPGGRYLDPDAAAAGAAAVAAQGAK